MAPLHPPLVFLSRWSLTKVDCTLHHWIGLTTAGAQPLVYITNHETNLFESVHYMNNNSILTAGKFSRHFLVTQVIFLFAVGGCED